MTAPTSNTLGSATAQPGRSSTERFIHGHSAHQCSASPHRFRHTAATDLLEAGQDIRLVRALLDHEDLNTTALYTKITDARLAGAVAALPSFRPVSGLPLRGPASVPEAEQAN